MNGSWWARLAASFGGVGFAPRAPGTMGTLAALPFGWALLQAPGLLVAAILVVSVGGIAVVQRAGGGVDHGWIVIDEVAGLWITLLGLVGLPRLPPLHGIGLAIGLGAAFLVFRVLDIGKPGPIGRLDQRHDALGVMGDDIVAGLAGAVLLLMARWTLGWGR